MKGGRHGYTESVVPDIGDVRCVSGICGMGGWMDAENKYKGLRSLLIAYM